MNEGIVHDNREFANMTLAEREAILDELRKQFKESEERRKQRYGSTLQLICMN